MITIQRIKPAMIGMVLMAFLLVAGTHFYSSFQTYSCTGQQKIYLSANEHINVRIKINTQPKKVSMTVKGAYHQADGSVSKIYRQGTYQYRQFYDEVYEAKLLLTQRVFTDTSPEQMSNNIFGIQAGESRNFRMKKLRTGLLVFGTEYAWIYACRIDT
ncbi:hypothetical protein [Klebsiella huaxiensis]|uniref:Uncharacterized protein n=1 Tax=Klebsiella huaxiensis TaxID=2153354 RepID=A0A564HSG4_9ENTR|nr:hypothetical protein [Klebsiella huaxiensis]VUS35341.1 hypothetical protein SB6422_04469 [Klebsiella huaxiensis]